MMDASSMHDRSALQFLRMWLLFVLPGIIFPAAWAQQSDPRASLQRPAPNDAAPNADITLPEALERALRNSPELASSDLDIRIAEAREIQAGLRQNPSVSFEIEDIRWSRGPALRTHSRSIQVDSAGAKSTYDSTIEQGAAPGIGESQTTLYLSQVVELGGKRVKRMRVARKEKDLARWDYETKRMDVLAEVTKSFVETLSAQERVALAEKNVEIAQQVLKDVAARVEAGKVSPLDASKAETELASTGIALNTTTLENIVALPGF
jgi:cobalt-zinc-cadmium efflux system outer membrane protein